MGRKVEIGAGFHEIVLPDGRTYDEGQQVLLNDTQWGEIDPDALSSGIVVDLGSAVVESGLLPTWFQIGDGPPYGLIDPVERGALYRDIEGGLYIAIGTANTDWVAIGGAADTSGGGFRAYFADLPAEVRADGKGFDVSIDLNKWSFKTDGGLALPGGNTLYNAAAAPANTVGADGDWALGTNGHIYFKAAGAWSQKV